MTPRPFSPVEPGTSEPTWCRDDRWDSLPVATARTLGAARLLVLAAHPDDETLGVGALVADAARAGIPIHIVIATDGAASHPQSPLWSPARLAGVRRDEVEHAAHLLAPGARVQHLDLPDGRLADDPSLLSARLREVLPDPAPGDVVLSPYAQDGHPDHDVLGEVAAPLAAERGADHWSYPIWWWQWALPDDLPWERLLLVAPSAPALHAKAAAVAAHRSQVGPLSPLPGDEALLPPHVLARFARVVETLIAGTGTTHPHTEPAEARRREDRRAAFARMLTGDDDDPWGSRAWYERRKHALTLAARSRERYGRAVEVGCATGALTARVAQVADHVTAYDGAAAALAVARRRDLANVTWVEAELPSGLAEHPDATADLVVVSEVAYFLTGPELLALLRQVRRLLREGGEVIVVDWLEGSDTLPLDGGLVHDQIDAAWADLPLRVRYEDDSVRLQVRGGAPIVPGEAESPGVRP